MSDNEEPQKSGWAAFLELGKGFLELGWSSLGFASKVAGVLLPAKLLAKHSSQEWTR